jgi:hypothetical protein
MLKKMALCLVLLALCGTSSALADQVNLFEWIVGYGTIDSYQMLGTAFALNFCPSGAICSYDDPFTSDDESGGVVGDFVTAHSGFDFITGLGTFSIPVVGPGNPTFVYAYFDHEILDVDNSFDNEWAESVGGTQVFPPPMALVDITPIGANPSQFWQASMGSIGLADAVVGAAILGNFSDVEYDLCSGGGCDPAMAMEVDFYLPEGQAAIATFTVGQTRPTSGFFIEQDDIDFDPANPGPDRIYFQATGAVPEPGTWTMIVVGVGLLVGCRRLRRAH